MAKFRCKHSGNIFSFTTDFDIQTMRQHSEYEEVVNQDSLVTEAMEDKVKQEVRRGRPPKEVK